MAFFDDFKKSINEVSSVIVKKSEKIVEVQKLKMKKTALQSDIRKDYEVLGQVYFNQMEMTGEVDEPVEEVFQRIVEAKEALEEVNGKIEKLSKGKVCSCCGEKSPKIVAYCPYCGTKFEPLSEEETCEEDDCWDVEDEDQVDDQADASTDSDDSTEE